MTRSLATWLRSGLFASALAFFVPASVQGQLAVQSDAPPGILTLRNGTRIGPGIRSSTSTLSTNSMQKGQGPSANEPILFVDDGLRLTYVNRSRVDAANSLDTINTAPEEIRLPNERDVARGEANFAIVRVLEVSKFNEYGRRTYMIETLRGPQVFLQGITKITPLYAELETLQTEVTNNSAWNQRIATTTLSSETLNKILRHELDLTRSSEYMRLYRFYLQCERYRDARDTLVEAIEKFPELEAQRELLTILDQALADQMFREIDQRRRAGQTQLASKLLKQFPTNTGDGPITETQLSVESQLERLRNDVLEISEVVESLKKHLAELPPADATLVRATVEEIINEIDFETQGRLADYARFRNEATMSLDQRIAFAIGGWLMGSGSGLDNFETAKSVIRVHALVREYLSTADTARREEILTLLSKEEGGNPKTLGMIIAAMKPPVPFPEAEENAIPGLHHITVPPGNAQSGSPVEYLVQLPPEYNPRRLYPCIVALPGLGVPTDMEIGWWCGSYSDKLQLRVGAASRYGYIVISPKWMTDQQVQYDYSEAEHERILRCVRDCMRRCSIDTDRIFVSGHFDGGAAAWDLALSHPDMWAGAIMISPSADKYIVTYGPNAISIPTYTVWGQYGGNFKDMLGRTVDNYLQSSKYDAIAVEYKGRPRDHFLEEVPRIIDWMEMTSHRRERSPKELDFVTSRSADRFFYWLEFPTPANAPTSGTQYDAARRPKVEAKYNDNLIRISKIPSNQATVWLRPDMVNFDQPVEVSFRGNKDRINVKANAKILLEDVRTRADRQAPFYARVSLPK